MTSFFPLRASPTISNLSSLSLYLFRKRQNNTPIILYSFIFRKRKLYWFQGYIEVIHRLEKFSASPERAHNQWKFDENPNTLILSILRLNHHLSARANKSLATYAKKWDTATRISCEVCRWRIAHVQSQCVVEKITYKKEDCLLSKTTAFLQSQTDQHKTAAPTTTSGLKFFDNPFSQLPNILNPLRGLDMPQAAYTEARTIHKNRQSKSRCCIVSFSWQK